MLSLCLLHLARTSKTYRRRTPIACTLSRHSPFPTVSALWIGYRCASISFVYREPRMQKFVTAARSRTPTESLHVCLLLTHATRFTIIYGQGFNKSTRIRAVHHISCGIFNGSVAKFHRFRCSFRSVGQREIANEKQKESASSRSVESQPRVCTCRLHAISIAEVAWVFVFGFAARRTTKMQLIYVSHELRSWYIRLP